MSSFLPQAHDESQISDDQMARYSKLIYDVTGNKVSPQKKALLSNRIRRRLRETGITGYDAYLEHLKKLRDSDPEWAAFLQEVTTHETYLFRDDGHWQWFQKSFLPQAQAEQRAGTRNKQLRIWSAACSTGDEACTIALSIAAANLGDWDVKVIGTDIGIDAVAAAKLGVFGARSMRLVPAAMSTKYFTKVTGPAGDAWKVKPELWSMCDFRQHNLLQPAPAVKFDVVFLKNVMIYFDDASKIKVVSHLRKVFKPGGYLVVGAAEGVTEHLQGFTRVQPWLHQWTGASHA